MKLDQINLRVVYSKNMQFLIKFVKNNVKKQKKPLLPIPNIRDGNLNPSHWSISKRLVTIYSHYLQHGNNKKAYKSEQ